MFVMLGIGIGMEMSEGKEDKENSNGDEGMCGLSVISTKTIQPVKVLCDFPGCKTGKEPAGEFVMGRLSFCSNNCLNKYKNYARQIVTQIGATKETLQGCEETLLRRRKELAQVFTEGSEHRYKFFQKGWRIVPCTVLKINLDDDSIFIGNMYIRYADPETGEVIVKNFGVFPEDLIFGLEGDVSVEGVSRLNTVEETVFIEAKEPV